LAQKIKKDAGRDRSERFACQQLVGSISILKQIEAIGRCLSIDDVNNVVEAAIGNDIDDYY
jgi:hypothetical protein